MDASLMARMKELEDENCRLKIRWGEIFSPATYTVFELTRLLHAGTT